MSAGLAIWYMVKGALLSLWGFIKSWPWPVWLAIAIVIGGWYYGDLQYERGDANRVRIYAAEKAKLEARIADLKARQPIVTERVVTQYVDKVRIVRERGATIIKEVPVYVPASAPDLPGGFRLLHDAAARGSALPDPARIADAAAVPAQDAAETVIDNYTACRATSEQLIALQTWVREQEKLHTE